MGVFGKLLIFLNILAAGGFVYLATEVWAKRNAWAAAALQHEVAIQGLPLQKSATPVTVDEGSVPFDFKVNDAVRLKQLARKTLQTYVPGGGDFGGDLVIDQTAEVDRLHKLIQGKIAAIDGPPVRRTQLLVYLLNLAQSGPERDGLTALLRDLHQPNRLASARLDLPLLGRTPAQSTALAALLQLTTLNDAIALQNREQVNFAKKALADAARAAAASTVPPGLTDDQIKDALNKLNNAVIALLEANGDTPDAGRITAAKEALKSAAPDSSKADLLGLAGDIGGNMLADVAAVADARAKLEALIVANARSEGEKAAMKAVAAIITTGQKLAELSDEAGKGLLDAYFQEAMEVAAESDTEAKQGKPDPAFKRAAIAHLLYHIDANQAWEQRAAWHQRVQAVVGMVAYVRAADRQATALATMAQRLKGQIFQTAGQFEAEYQALVQRAIFLSKQFDDINSRLDDQKKLESDHQLTLNAREQEKDEVTKEYNKVRADAKTALKDLRNEQQKLFQLNAKIRQAQDELFDLEVKLRALEERVVNAAPRAKN